MKYKLLSIFLFSIPILIILIIGYFTGTLSEVLSVLGTMLIVLLMVGFIAAGIIFWDKPND
jgi:ABC-type polysaccharide/polyol phosphate export permease